MVTWTRTADPPRTIALRARVCAHVQVCVHVNAVRVQAAHFNRTVGLWEPLLEPAQVSLELRQPPRTEVG